MEDKKGLSYIETLGKSAEKSCADMLLDIHQAKRDGYVF